MQRRAFYFAMAAYLLFCGIAFVRFFPFARGEIFSSDAAVYSQGAIHLLQSGFYSSDGVHPLFSREPGMSLFLAAVYAIFGIENAYALFLVQATLYYCSVLWFCRSLRNVFGERVAALCFFLLLTYVSVFHTIFSAYRECFALVLLLSFASLFLSFLRDRTMLKALASGAVLGGVILTYSSFLLFPFFLAVVLWRHRIRFREAVILVVLPFVVVAPWFIRNAQYGRAAQTEVLQRMTYVWYVRAEQAEKVHGLEPLRCLWSEYVSRDWSGRSDACSFNGVKNREWPRGVPNGNEAQVARVSQLRIVHSLPSYLWFSVFEILELHLPYVGGGWSFAFNLGASVAAFFLYLGCFLGMPFLFHQRSTLFVALMLYHTLFFIFTDATPRYLLPILFCYTVFAAYGYERLLHWYRHR